MTLSWQAPTTPADSYQVRRCALSSLLVTYYGNCVAEGLTSPGFAEAPPAGNVFYLVSGSFGGAEGSLGRNFDGLLWRDRSAPACSSPSLPYAMSIDVVLDSAITVCGSQLLVSYPAALASYVDTGSGCAGLFSAGFGVTNDMGGVLSHACVLPPGPGTTGPGVIARFNFQVGDCPLTAAAFGLLDCKLVDCLSNELPAQCSLQ